MQIQEGKNERMGGFVRRKSRGDGHFLIRISEEHLKAVTPERKGHHWGGGGRVKEDQTSGHLMLPKESGGF